MSTSETSGLVTDMAGLRELVGRHAGYTAWRTMEQDRVNLFAEYVTDKGYERNSRPSKEMPSADLAPHLVECEFGSAKGFVASPLQSSMSRFAPGQFTGLDSNLPPQYSESRIVPDTEHCLSGAAIPKLKLTLRTKRIRISVALPQQWSIPARELCWSFDV